MNRLLTGIYNLCKWITNLFYLNILWIAFSLLGGIVLGIMPSTAAMFAIARKTAMGEEDVPVLKTFWETYKQEFIRVNKLGLLLAVIGFVWYIDLQFFRSFEGHIYTVLNYVMIMIGMVYFILLLYIFPVYTHYDLPLLKSIKQALAIAFLRPGNLVLMMIGNLFTYYFLIYLPGLIPTFGITFFVFYSMWASYQCFSSLEYKSLERKSSLA